MEELRSSWKIALQILWRHNRIASKITSYFVFTVMILVICLNWLFSLGISYETIKTYKWLIVATSVFFFLFPANIYAAKTILNRNFGKFRLALIKHDGP